MVWRGQIFVSFKVMKRHVTIVALLCLLGHSNPVRAQQATNEAQIKDVIVSIQNDIVDLTDPLEPLHNAQFVAMRKGMTEKNAREIVQLIRRGILTNTQADIGVLLLSGLKERTYWVVTIPLLTTNIDAYALQDVLDPPFPYGPGYADTYKIEWFKKRLLVLEGRDTEIAPEIELILSGEDSRDYADYLKHPGKYGY